MAEELNRLERALRRALVDVAALGRGSCVVGGLAVSARTEPRFTRDVDLAVAVADDRQGEALVADMQARGYGVLATVEQQATKRLATVRLSVPGETRNGVVLDLLLASSGIEPEIVAAAESMEIMAGLVAPVAGIAHLIALKVLARDDRTRPQDAADLRALLKSASETSLADAATSLQEISRRGFHRERDLAAELARALRDFRSP